MIKRVRPGRGIDLGPSLDGRIEKLSDLDEETRAMARNSYGYGSWQAPCWFIGPEQGVGRHEKGDLESALGVRVAAWVKLGRLDLNDCGKFHCEIGEKNWHCKEPVNLQPTWRPLLLTLLTFLRASTDDEVLRAYQRDRWGRLDGETCVIELSGLAAPDLENANANPFLNERIQVICERIRTHQPRFVVMYGRMQRKSWCAIAKAVTGRLFPDGTETELPKTNILVHESTALVWTPAPTAHGMKNEYWVRLGQRLRKRL
jgi:hypothetical protein